MLKFKVKMEEDAVTENTSSNNNNNEKISLPVPVTAGDRFEEGLRNAYLKGHLPPKDLSVMVAKGSRFMLHKTYFMSVSPVFDEILRREGRMEGESVKLDIDSEVFKVILKFIYLHNIEHSTVVINGIDHALAVLETSVQFKIDRLDVQMGNKVQALLTTENVFKVLQVCRRLSQMSSKFLALEKKAFTTICADAENLLMSTEFLDLGSYDAARILSSDALRVNSELSVFKAALRWAESRAIKFNPNDVQTAKKYYFTTQFLGSIRFPCLTHEELARVAEEDVMELKALVFWFRYTGLPADKRMMMWPLITKDGRFSRKRSYKFRETSDVDVSSHALLNELIKKIGPSLVYTKPKGWNLGKVTRPRNYNLEVKPALCSQSVGTQTCLMEQFPSPSSSSSPSISTGFCTSMLPPQGSPSISSRKRRRISPDNSSEVGCSVSFAPTTSVIDDDGNRTIVEIHEDDGEEELFTSVLIKKDLVLNSFEDLSKKFVKREGKDGVGGFTFSNVTFEEQYHTMLYKNCKNFTSDFRLKYIETGGSKSRTENFIDFLSTFDLKRYLVFKPRGLHRVTYEKIWSLGQNILLKFNGITFLKVQHGNRTLDYDDDKAIAGNEAELVLNYIRDSDRILDNEDLKVAKLAMSNCKFPVKILKERRKFIRTLILYRCWGEYSIQQDILSDSFPNLEVLICWKENFGKNKNTLSNSAIELVSLAKMQNLKKVVLFKAQIKCHLRGSKNIACNVEELYLDHCQVMSNARSDHLSDVFPQIFPRLKTFILVEYGNLTKHYGFGNMASSELVNSVLGIDTLESIRISGMKWANDNQILAKSEDEKLREVLTSALSSSMEEFVDPTPHSFELTKNQRGRSVLWEGKILVDLRSESVEVEGGGWSQNEVQEYDWYSLNNFYENLEIFEDYFLQEKDKFPGPNLWF